MALAALGAALLLAACGGSESEKGGGTPATSGDGGGSVTDQLFKGSAADNRTNPEEGGKKGGKLTVLSAGDVDYMDPGKTYYTYAIGIMNTLHRGLYAYLPGDTSKPVPDLAEGDSEIAADGRTVTVKIKKGVMFSEPVKREVTTKDVKYAIERAFTANVANGYARVYFGDLIGAPKKPGDYQEIEGIETPDDQTIVFKLSQGTGAALAGALAMPISIPVPKEFAQKYDEKNPSTYGEQYAVFTGPYKVESDAQGKQTGYVAGKRISIVRNPDYAAVDDFRPAFLDAVDIRGGNEDTAVATRRILSGKSLASGEIEPPANQLKRLLQSNKKELSAVPGGGWRIISMDTSRPPFDDLNVRKAVIAGFNRNAVRQQRGGEALGPIAQGLIPPGMAGFEESNGIDGYSKEFDWLAKPEGDRTLSAEYFKKAGSSTGKYGGNEELLIVADSAEPEKSIAQITEQQLNELGFKTKLRLVTRDTMFTKFCNVPKSEVNVCPSVGWLLDFSDPQVMLDPTFNGNNIPETGNSNWPELDVPEVNQAIEKAKLETEPGPRAKSWAEVNKLIMAQAPIIPYMWDYQAVVASPNVRAVQNGYSTTWDWNFTSLR
ncbi:MAG TPA: ABC transporter substrate-binding protein [Solirubrobacteraceae bacterium]|nr:ABC transporter substrate-binding protein [Solirubrobacteraceae bacterium]